MSKKIENREKNTKKNNIITLQKCYEFKLFMW